METTPSSTTRRVTRSQTVSNSILNNNNNIPMSRKIEDSEKGVSKSRPRTMQDRSALIDITNDSPIVGLAMGNLETPSSAMSKKRIIINNNSHSKQAKTPGSGEALLRGQVKTLLQRVEEEAEISKMMVSSSSIEDNNKQRFLNFQGFVNSPIISFLAPTPTNTPQMIESLVGDESFKKGCLAAVTPSPVQEQLMMIPQMNNDMLDGEKDLMITRSLLFDFSEKSVCTTDDSSSSICSSALANEIGSESIGKNNKKSASEDDDSSVWSIQVNTSARDDDDDEEGEFGDYIDNEDEEEDDNYFGYEDDGLLVDELCEGISKISVNGNVAKFEGKHTRFVYNSDGEIEGEEECGSENVNSPGVVRWNGLPTTKGKHLRFPEEGEEDN